MKKVLVSLCACCAVFALFSCRSAKEVAPLTVLDGEWNIVEINGSAVVPGFGKDFPYIGFNTATGQVSGNSGCNRMMGSFDRGAKPGVMNLSEIAGTRMACPDMTLEQNVLNTLKNVKGFRKHNGESIALTNSRNRPVVVLEPRNAVSLISSLEGEWKIVSVKGEAVPTGLDKEPFLSFNIQTKRIHGNAGCNLINGGIVTDDSNARSISFPAMAATMMACPNMTLERKVLDALSAVKAFDVFVDKTVGLYDENGTQLLALKKK